MTTWALQDAKGRFSQVVEQAKREGPQMVTKRGEGAVVVVAVEQFRQWTRREGHADLVTFLQHSPLSELDPSWLERDRSTGREVAL